MVLLDTCTLLWLAAGSDRLSAPARTRIAGSAGGLFVSAISAFEVGVKSAKGALTLPLPAGEWYEAVLDHHGLAEIPVTGRIAAAATALPRLHADPCDRILVATAIESGLTVLTPDPLVAAYPEVRTEW